MEPLYILAGICALIIVACVYLNNKQHTFYAGVVTQLTDALKSAKAAVAPAPATITHTVTVTTPGVAGAVGTVGDNVNGSPIPAGMTQASFGQLVNAVSGVAVMLANTALHTALLASSAAWWANSLGAYYREQLLAQATGDVLAAMTALSTAAGAPALVPITPAQQSAANQAAGVTGS